MADNYCEWLGLPVDKFENDPVKLKLYVDKFISDCNSSSSTRKQQQGALHQAEMYRVINEPDEWKRIYEDYKKSIDNQLVESFEMCAIDHEITDENISSIAAMMKITEMYVKDIAKKTKYIESEPTPNPESRPKTTFTIKDLEPPVAIKGTLDGIQSSINQLGFPTLAELINHELNIEVDLSTISKEKILEALKEIKKIWSRVSASNKEKYQHKSNYDKICSGLTMFFKKYEISDYLKYLNWKQVSDILVDTNKKLTALSLSAMNESLYNSTIDNIYSIIGDREKSKSLVIEYCGSKGISYPKPLPNISICPYCSVKFEKSKPLQNACPTCRKSFIVKCPKCNQQKNFLEDISCDGVDLLQYPNLLSELEKSRKLLEFLDYNMVKIKAKKINSIWSNFPGVKELLNECETIENTYGQDISNVKKLISENKYYEAKRICETIGTKYPKFKDSYKSIYNTCASADKTYKEASDEKNKDRKIELLLEIISSVSDHPEALRELRAEKIEEIKNLNVKIDNSIGAIVISWTSANKPNSVSYIIRRKLNSPVSNVSDGEEIINTQSCSYSDSTLEEGKIYYYAVYACRGPIETALKVYNEPVVMLKKPELSVIAKDSSISVSWLSSPIVHKAFISDSPIKNHKEGKACEVLNDSGFDAESLVNGKKYYIAVYKTVVASGKEYNSEIALCNVTPMEKISPPEIIKKIGESAGEYIIEHTNYHLGDVFEIFYSSTQASVPSNNFISYSEIQKNLRKATLQNKGNNIYSFNMNSVSEVYIYPVLKKDSSAFIGAYICLHNAKPIKVTKHRISGNDLVLYIDEWVDGADSMLICYNDDRYPEDIKDCDRKISISKEMFKNNEVLEIKQIKLQMYYITIFARKKGEYIPVCNYKFDNTGEKKHESGVVKTVIEYFLKYSVFGSVSVVLESKSVVYPDIEVCINRGSVPLYCKSGELVYTIPAGEISKKPITIPKLKKSMTSTYLSLFTTDEMYIIRRKYGSGKIGE